MVVVVVFVYVVVVAGAVVVAVCCVDVLGVLGVGLKQKWGDLKTAL